MDKSKKHDETTTCHCDCCDAEIPLSTAVTPESMDYVRHFCGDNCYEKWKKEHSGDDVNKS